MTTPSIIIFDTLNVKTALIANMLVTSSKSVHVYFPSNSTLKTDENFVFIDGLEDDTSLFYPYCNFHFVKYSKIDEDEEKGILMLDISESEIIDKLISSTRIYSGIGSNIDIDHKNRIVLINDGFETTKIPFDRITQIYESKPIDKIFNYSNGEIKYIGATFNNNLYTDEKKIEQITHYSSKSGIDKFYVNNKIDKNDSFSIKHSIVESKTDFQNIYGVDICSLKTFNKYNKQIDKSKTKYIGPSLKYNFLDSFVYDLSDITNIIKL